MGLPARVALLRRGAPGALSRRHACRALHTADGGAMAATRADLCERTYNRPSESAKDAAAQCRSAFQHFVRLRSSEYTGARPPPTCDAAAAAGDGEALEGRGASVRHALEAVDVRPTARAGEAWGGVGPAGRRPRPAAAASAASAPRGQRDLRRLHQRAARVAGGARQAQLRAEYERAVHILRDIRLALEAIVLPRSTRRANDARERRKDWLDSTEAVRFERLHQLRDTTSRLSTAHFLPLPVAIILQFLELIGGIVALVQAPHTTAHGYVVRQAMRALFIDADAATPRAARADAAASAMPARPRLSSGLHYYKLLRSALSLPGAESIEVCDAGGSVMSVEELCVRRLGSGVCVSADPSSKTFLHEIGTIRAVRVVAWCLRQATASPALLQQAHKRYFPPPRGELRIPFGVGKEYTQRVLASFAGDNPRGGAAARGESEAAERRRTPFAVTELAMLCGAIVFYEIRTMEAVRVLVEAAPVCAAEVDVLSGHQLSCVLLAYATLRYHGDLARHPPTSPHATLLSRDTRQTNFYLLLGERAGAMGEELHEDDAARVLRALAMVDVEHEGLRRSLESSMRMKGLRRRVLLS
ncbi:uncharacterized protein Tco025E_06800 [Trypanosoma conorhini]|uniref:Uncharacterized protein n=1 Tax=Trypanosoma conorhini TaxID=83891 RepID=A0A422NY04_9TRYP|nr:uncharacterized protein Tco025E_06800 [Trypanosoma conorhini]RNF10311.1 hypothetical protein Tco025E_06800 [Trypanosoma conorhini]